MREEGREEEDESDDFTNDSTPQKWKDNSIPQNLIFFHLHTKERKFFCNRKQITNNLNQMAGNPLVNFHNNAFYAFFPKMHKMNMIRETYVHVSSPNLLNEFNFSW
jgi:hypothetical protein